jgi:hypothetical protein
MTDTALAAEYEQLAHDPEDPWARFGVRIDEVLEELRDRFAERLKATGPLGDVELAQWREWLGAIWVDRGVRDQAAAAEREAMGAISIEVKKCQH